MIKKVKNKLGLQTYTRYTFTGGDGGWGGWPEKLRIRLSQLPTKLKLKLSLAIK